MVAQDRWPVTAELYLGATRGYGDNVRGYRGSRNGVLAEILTGTRLHPVDRAGPILALHFGAHVVNPFQTDDCVVAPDGTPCAPWFPGFGVVSFLGGWESRTTDVRFLAGPGYATTDPGAGTASLIGRADAAVRLLGRLSAVGSLSSLLVPSYNEDLFFNIALGVGLRLR
jgi:hypothetical protein